MRSRYSEWDGRQDPFADDLDLGRILDELSDDLMSGFGARWALRRLQHRGLNGIPRGLDELARAVRQLKRREGERLDLSGPLADVLRRLEEVVAEERNALSGRDDADAQLRRALLDTLPHHPAEAIRELTAYDFVSPDAARHFQELVDYLKREVLNSYFRGISGSMKNMSPEEVARLKDMLAELNSMIAARDRGDACDFDGFMARFGDFFPENPRNLDQLLEILARRMAAMSRMLAGLTPQQRRELADLASALLDDLDLAFKVDQLGRSLAELMPQLPWSEPLDSWGDEPMPMSEAVDAIERISEYEELEHVLEGEYAGATLEDIDEDKLRDALGDDAVRDLRRLKEIERFLERSGVLQRSGGELEITARGARLLGERALTKLLERIRREPTHRARGGQAEPTGQTRPWVFGDDDPISVEKTVFNAVVRAGRGRLRLEAADFEVVETETRPRTATALLLDLSFSMPLRGHWIPAKRMALALHALIEGKYPQDSLYLIGFSDYARRMQAAELTSMGWDHVHGTNMQHAFLLASRLLGEDPRPIRQVIMVTDGEPTAHLKDGYALFNWPPIPETIETTLREAVRVSRSGISINVFMLERSPGLVQFMDRLARLTGGRVFGSVDGELGSFVIRDYLDRAAG